jgi:predicted DNA-binding transcriptional regulator AlpA
MTQETQRYLDEHAAAQRLKVAERTLQRWRSTGDGPPFIRAGLRRVLYDVEAIDAWAAARTFAHRAEELARAAA